MNKIVHLSITKKDVPTRIDVVQYATEPSIVFVLDDYTPATGATANLYIKKPDGTEVYNSCTISGNQVTYKPTTQSFAALGTNKCQLQIVKSGNTAVSFLIYADVTENIIDSSAIESQDEFTALEEALSTVSSYDGRITSNTNRLNNLGDEKLTFTEAAVDTTISDNLTLSTIFGRIKRLFTRVKALEDTPVVTVAAKTLTISFSDEVYKAITETAPEVQGYTVCGIVGCGTNNVGYDVYRLYLDGSTIQAGAVKRDLQASTFDLVIYTRLLYRKN